MKIEKNVFALINLYFLFQFVYWLHDLTKLIKFADSQLIEVVRFSSINLLYNYILEYIIHNLETV